MYLRVFALASSAYTAAAMPGMAAMLEERQSLPTLPLSQAQGNSGPFPSLQFNAADQFVDVRPGTAHQYIAPGPNDKRGPCPGLNAAANHGFLPRSGVTTITQTVNGLGAAYSFGPEFAAALSVIAIGLTGDPTGGTWSIGGPYPPSLLGGLLSNPSGISKSHNTYESDTSPARSDAYLNGGDAVSLNITRFDKLYFSAQNYTLDILRDHNKLTHTDSIQNNPYYFSAPFAGLVPPIAHHFIVNLMSNHSADNIQGYLNRDILKTFFAVSGPDNGHVWNAGQEKIPQNWYKRPSNNPYGAAAAAADVAILAVKYPEIVQFGGNTGTPNSFVGVNPGDISGGVYNAQTLLQGNNLGCFFFQAAQQAIPSVLSGVLSNLTPFLNILNGAINPVLGILNCPALLTFDQSAFEQFPGYGYHPAKKV
ncbi:Cloroperoxidase [Glarea lozoyensis ATCC 20868]|uniref:Cloroperoxidase n=1 Tax=Glarea lozoyensis (strain ATCC 20868 / MF5171) TaxID=1116229 RepID=S3CVA0_GLAL2|nr:Cloroperoxidase [Glarea lozoyensis ATCC 20868]EPE28884.1 Cloroperoxidase [Glarea lozoyensis ATCC 20868]